MNRLIEIRAYKLKPNALAEFHHLVGGVAAPMLRDWETDVVAFGASEHEPDSYFLIRSYADLDDLNTRQDAFYGSHAWRDGPREAILALIDSYLSTVLWLTTAAIDDLRHLNQTANP